MSEKQPTPLIQDLVKTFAEQNVDKILYVENIASFFLFNEEKGYFRFLGGQEMDDLMGPFLDMSLQKNVTDSVFATAYRWLRIYCFRRLKSLDGSHIIFNDKKVLDLNSLTFDDPRPDQNIFYHINCDSPDLSKPIAIPVFSKFLETILVDDDLKPDPALLTLAQEMFGYYLSDKLEPPIAFFFVGEGANGKSTLQFVLEQLAGGSEFVMANSIENLTGARFDAEELRYKRLNVCSEEQSKFVRPDKFKSIIDGSLIHADIKYQKAISFRPRTKHLFSSNQLPKFSELDHGLERRLKFIPFKRRFSSRDKDITLKTERWEDSRFAPELPGIIAWAIEGAKRLKANNYDFTHSAAVNAEWGKYEEEVSSPILFLRDNFLPINETTEENGQFFAGERLYRLYSAWCKLNNKKPYAINNFRTELKNTGKLPPFNAPKHDNVLKKTSRGWLLSVRTDSELRSAIEYSSLMPEFIEAAFFNEPDFSK